nr:NADH dehydrogenase subunit 4 [Shaddai sp. SL-2021a]
MYMMEIYYLLFMIPTMMYMNWYLVQMFLLVLMVMFIMMNYNTFFSCISYSYGFDYISYSLIILSLLITSLMVMASYTVQSLNNKTSFIFMILILCFSLIIIFSSLNMIVMYLFFEFSLIPLLLMIFGWGYQPERLISGLYLFFYTLFASLPLLLVILYLYMNNGSMFFDSHFFESTNFFFYFSMIIAFLVKMPMFMVHFWLPKAHVQAPVSGSMILAGLLLKVGGYGILRFMVMYEAMFLGYSYIWYSLSILGSILVSLICFIQGDVKCLIAYSSVAHMGMCLMSILTMTKWGVFGGFFLMISHGLCSSALFALANISYERYLSRSFMINKGLLLFMPSMSIFWFMFCSFNMSCPPSLNFISEVFMICAMFNYWSCSFIYFFFISLLSACFSYYLFSYTQHGYYHLVYSFSAGSTREYLLLMIHLIPIFMIILMMNLIYI